MSFQPSTPTVAPRGLADDAVMLDVREQDEWDVGHAPNAVHIPLGEVSSRLGELAELTDSGDVLPVVCRSGARSGRAVAWLVQQGVDSANVDGGMMAWAASGKPIVAPSGDPARVK